MHTLDEAPELYRTMARFRAVAHELACRGYGDCPEEESLLARWRRWLRRAYHAVRAQGAEARAASGTGTLRQFVELVEVQRRFAFDTKHYYWYRLFERDRYRRAGLFAVVRQMQPFLRYVRHTIDPAVRLAIDDKARFREHCRRHDLPSIPTLAVVEAGRVVWREAEALPAADLFAKPLDAHSGSGACVWHCIDEERYRASDGTVCTVDGVLDGLRSRSHATPYLVQPRMRNHAAVERLVGPGLASVRAITVRNDGADVQLLMTRLLAPLSGAVVSNTAAGGLFGPLDVAQGVVEGVGLKDEPLAPLRAHHPETHTLLAGATLPDWQRARVLAERAHATFPEVPMLGTDLAFTPDGPVLVEANLGFAIEPLQMLGDPPLALSGIPQRALHYFDGVEAHARP